MKRILMVAIILMVGATAAMAQKGNQGVGVNLLYGSEISNLGFGVKYEYGITDALRLAPSFEYYLEKDGAKLWDVNANLNYVFDVTERVNVYPLAGLGYAKAGDEGEFAVNLGCGGEYQLKDKLYLFAELRYQIISNFNQLAIGVGVTYKF